MQNHSYLNIIIQKIIKLAKGFGKSHGQRSWSILKYSLSVRVVSDYKKGAIYGLVYDIYSKCLEKVSDE